MAIIVQKFGGTSVANIERIKLVAQRVHAELKQGNQVPVVVSAMSGVTDQLVAWAKEVSVLNESSQLAEYDTVLSSGEQVTCGLLSLALQQLGVKSRSWLGWQIPIITDSSYSKARIERVNVTPLLAGLAQGEVAVIAGFQGTNAEHRITTLGRGGSDTTAVALAASLHAERCDIYTDVEGVYTTDPRIVTKAHKLRAITYEEMLEMASLGAKVLQTRSVEMAMKHKVRVQVLSTFHNTAGTMVIGEEEMEEKAMEQRLITGLAYSRNEARVTLTNVPDRPGVAAGIFGPLAEADINVDMIIQNISRETHTTDMTFTVAKQDLDRALALLQTKQGELHYESLAVDKNVAKISAIGVGMRSHAGVAQQMFTALAEKGINILVITTSEIKVSVLIAEEYTELALRTLHTAYGLDTD